MARGRRRNGRTIRNNASRQTNLKTRQMKTRLMQIHFLVEDLVYLNKSIPVTHAQNYYAELVAIRRDHELDAPSLQVLEKLQKIMKELIDEEDTGAAVEISGVLDIAETTAAVDITTNDPLDARDSVVKERPTVIVDNVESTSTFNGEETHDLNTEAPVTEINIDDGNVNDLNLKTRTDIHVNNVHKEIKGIQDKVEKTQDVPLKNIIDIVKDNITSNNNSDTDITSQSIIDGYTSIAPTKQNTDNFTNTPKSTSDIVKVLPQKKSKTSTFKDKGSINKGVLTKQNEKVEKKSKRKEAPEEIETENVPTLKKNKQVPKKSKPKFTTPLKCEGKTMVTTADVTNNSTQKEEKAIPENPFSWVKDIKYVREVDEAEYCEPTGLFESIWEN